MCNETVTKDLSTPQTCLCATVKPLMLACSCVI